MMRRLIFLVLCGAAVLLEPNVATADGERKPGASDPRAEEARRRYVEGMRATDAGDFERARLAYLQTYALNQSPEVLRNLGVAEIRTGRLAEGARHLSAYLRGTPATTEDADQRRYAEDLLKETEAKIARLSVRVDVAGAEILVDGESAGRSPLDFDWHVDSGFRLVTVRTSAIERTKRLTVRPGEVIQLTFRLAADRGAASPQPTVPATTLPVRAGLDPRPTESHAERTRPARRPAWPIYLGSGIALAAAATGTVATLSASSNQDDLERVRARLGPSGCRPPAPSAADCADVARLVDRYDRNVHFSRAAWVVFGVSGIATIAYVAWPASTPPSARRMAIAVGPRGVAVRGLF